MEQEKTLVKKRIALFVALTYGITWIIFMIIPLTGQKYGSLTATLIIAAGMFVPASCSLLTRLITGEGFGNMYLRPHFKGNIKKYLFIFFGPTALLFLSAAVYFLIVPGSFDPEFTVLKELAASKSAAGLSVNMLLLFTGLQIAVIGPVINIIPTLGEELGWRGYLLPKLRRLVSDRSAMVITGVIWGLWHAPVIAMGHNYGTDYIGYPWLGILTMIVFCVVLGVIEGYATIRFDSVIPAAMIHSTVNAGAAFPVYLANSGYNPLLGPAITGLIGMLPFTALAVILFFRISSKMTADRNGIQTKAAPSELA